MKNILILHTGGTISMKQDDSAGILSSETNPLFHQSLNIKNVSMVQEELFNIPSEHMTPS